MLDFLWSKTLSAPSFGRFWKQLTCNWEALFKPWIDFFIMIGLKDQSIIRATMLLILWVNVLFFWRLCSKSSPFVHPLSTTSLSTKIHLTFFNRENVSAAITLKVCPYSCCFLSNNRRSDTKALFVIRNIGISLTKKGQPSSEW